MNRFELESENGLFIRHCIFPRCQIEIICLPSEAYYEGGLDSIFDLFVFRSNNGNILFQFLITEFNEPGIDGPENVFFEDVHIYRNMLTKAWKWLLHGYLLADNKLPSEPRSIQPDGHDDKDSLFSIEVEDGNRYVYHRGVPLFRARLKPEQDALGILDDIEFLEDVNLEYMDIAALMSEMGDWLAKKLA
jgi:hypothetical protein